MKNMTQEERLNYLVEEFKTDSGEYKDIDPPKPVYSELLELIKDKDYFVVSTNVDHQFQRAGFDKKRLFYTQGDYGLFQTVNGRNGKTYDNEEWIMKAM